MNKLNHIAFIMDGNGRWGRKKNKGRDAVLACLSIVRLKKSIYGDPR